MATNVRSFRTPMMQEDVHWTTASDLAAAFHSKEISPYEVAKHLADRVETLDPHINAFIRFDREDFLDQAREAEREMLTSGCRGPLHGIPIGIKDIIDVAEVPTTCHSKLLLENIPTVDAEVVRRLRAAGALIMGKLSTWEFAIGGPCFDLPFPPARNPWSCEHQPGGSSTGSGAGVAAGFFPLAIGSDTGGSIRHPAAACGVFGLKPTYDLVSRRGVFPLSFTLDNVGPLARTVGDIARTLDVIADPDRKVAGGYAAEINRPMSELRIGFVRHFHEEDLESDDEVRNALDESARVFSSLGASVKDVRLVGLSEFAAVNRIILHSEAWSIHANWLRSRPEDYGQKTRRRLLSGAFISAGDYVNAQRSRRRLIGIVEECLRDVDLLLVANALDPASPFEDTSSTSPVQARQARTPFNVTGHPAISLMSGLSRSGLPLSFQLVGRFFQEKSLLSAAAAFENMTDWSKLHPKFS